MMSTDCVDVIVPRLPTVAKVLGSWTEKNRIIASNTMISMYRYPRFCSHPFRLAGRGAVSWVAAFVVCWC
jgi:hypothetical protein